MVRTGCRTAGPFPAENMTILLTAPLTPPLGIKEENQYWRWRVPHLATPRRRMSFCGARPGS